MILSITNPKLIKSSLFVYKALVFLKAYGLSKGKRFTLIGCGKEGAVF
jgi:hypothetical protein